MRRSGGDAGEERTLEREIGEPIAAASVAAVSASVMAATMDREGRELPARDERQRRRDFASTGGDSGGSRLPVGWRLGVRRWLEAVTQWLPFGVGRTCCRRRFQNWWKAVAWRPVSSWERR
ncbi:hypothetical protein LR48_Vigan347s003400 [Vigna angularis]|uniref:Uncharacterized protein n=1 Tax=Phaseolus angularis TaxID=3914 RepID=A0A0L9T8Q1_PHAAN|nr:hypothetical protein LR48_Vigan347s003400 [Vigna angularis]